VSKDSLACVLFLDNCHIRGKSLDTFPFRHLLPGWWGAGRMAPTESRSYDSPILHVPLMLHDLQRDWHLPLGRKLEDDAGR